MGTSRGGEGHGGGFVTNDMRSSKMTTPVHPGTGGTRTERNSGIVIPHLDERKAFLGSRARRDEMTAGPADAA
jgi:hypothetical protein